jgi:hypothetical protein
MAERGREGWLERQLDGGQGVDIAVRIRPAQGVIAAAPIRAVHAKAQLHEVMTRLWHDHFDDFSGKDDRAAVFVPLSCRRSALRQSLRRRCRRGLRGCLNRPILGGNMLTLRQGPDGTYGNA